MVRGAWLYVLRKGPDNWPPVSNAGSRRRRAGAGAAGAVGHHRRGRGGRLAAAQALLKGGGRRLCGAPPRDLGCASGALKDSARRGIFPSSNGPLHTFLFSSRCLQNLSNVLLLLNFHEFPAAYAHSPQLPGISGISGLFVDGTAIARADSG